MTQGDGCSNCAKPWGYHEDDCAWLKELTLRYVPELHTIRSVGETCPGTINMMERVETGRFHFMIGSGPQHDPKNTAAIDEHTAAAVIPFNPNDDSAYEGVTFLDERDALTACEGEVEIMGLWYMACSNAIHAGHLTRDSTNPEPLVCSTRMIVAMHQAMVELGYVEWVGPIKDDDFYQPRDEGE